MLNKSFLLGLILATTLGASAQAHEGTSAVAAPAIVVADRDDQGDRDRVRDGRVRDERDWGRDDRYHENNDERRCWDRDNHRWTHHRRPCWNHRTHHWASDGSGGYILIQI